MISFSIKQRTRGKWGKLKVQDFAGKTLRQAMKTINGTEAVAEFVIDDQKIYFCGTKLWLERMSKKGKVVTFEMLVKILAEKAPNILDKPVPGIDVVSSFLGEACLETVNIDMHE